MYLVCKIYSKSSVPLKRLRFVSCWRAVKKDDNSLRAPEIAVRSNVAVHGRGIVMCVHSQMKVKWKSVKLICMVHTRSSHLSEQVYVTHTHTHKSIIANYLLKGNLGFSESIWKSAKMLSMNIPKSFFAGLRFETKWYLTLNLAQSRIFCSCHI